jgi:hypothetical protein
MEADADSLSRFEKALAQVGYSPAHDEEYAKLRLRIVEEGLFSVRDDFPRLTVMQLVAGIPSCVERVEYEINLSGFDHLRIATRATECPDL